VGKFMISDSEQVAPRLKAFGSSVIVLASLYDFSGDLTNLVKTLSSVWDDGFLDDKYTWIGAHQLSTGNCLVGRDVGDEEFNRRFAKMFSEMIFVRSSFSLRDEADAVWDDEFEVHRDDLQELLPDLDPSYLIEHKDFFLPDFANAYDSFLLVLDIFIFNHLRKGGKGNLMQYDPWWEAAEGTQLSCLTGPMRMLADKSRDGAERHVLTLFKMAKGLPQVLGSVDPDNISMAGISFRWRDGTTYPESVPRADIRPTKGLSTEMIAVAAVACIAVGLLALLLALSTGYLRLRKTLNSVSSSELDLESPLAKACTLLKEISMAHIVTRKMKQRALNVALALLNSENVHAPDLAGQKTTHNKDIMSYLMFSSDWNPKGRRGSGSSRTSAVSSLIPLNERADCSDRAGNPDWPPKQNRCQEPWRLGNEDFMDGAGTDLLFNVLKITDGHPLLSVSMKCFYSLGLVAALKLDEAALADYVAYIESGYKDVPYHNAFHAADVVSRTCAILQRDRILTNSDSSSDKLLLLSAVVAAVVHDYQHPGLSNGFLVATSSDISAEFNEQNVLENMSLSRALAALKKDKFNFLRNLPRRDQKTVHSNVIKIVLATDMSRHFEVLAAFKSKVCEHLLRRR